MPSSEVSITAGSWPPGMRRLRSASAAFEDSLPWPLEARPSNGRHYACQTTGNTLRSAAIVIFIFVLDPLPEIEHVEQIPDRRAVDRHIGIVSTVIRVREIVAAATGEWREVLIAFDELQDRDVVGVAVHNMPAL